MKKTEAIAILGPTGSGKSAIAVEVAKQMHGEIISCDSMQIYQDMAIGTAQPSIQELQACPHHLINCMTINQPYNTRIFLERANKLITQINQRNHLPIITGGTGLYARAIVYGMDLLPSDKEIFRQIKETYDNGNYPQLLHELQQTCPTTFAKVKDNWRRVLRTIEVLRVTGTTETFEDHDWNQKPRHIHEFVLMFSAEGLRKRVRKRAAQMLKNGWIDEAKALFAKGLLDTPTAHQALGYSIIHQYLNPVELANNQKHLAMPTEKELLERLVNKTCQYAKRQRTWFRHKHPNATFINMDEINRKQAIEKICNSIKETPKRKA